MWKLTQNREPKGKQELMVKTLLRELADYSYASYSEQFERHFKEEVVKIPKSNNFSADLLFKVTPRNLKSVEIWKMKPNGDFNYKMFTLDYVEET